MTFSTTYDEAVANRLLDRFVHEHKLDTRLDTCGEKIIPGPVGDSQIYAFDNTHLAVLFMPDPHAKHTDVQYRKTCGQWIVWRQRLKAAGCTIYQDCDAEGSSIFDPADAEQVRTVFQVVSLISHKERAA